MEATDIASESADSEEAIQFEESDVDDDNIFEVKPSDIPDESTPIFDDEVGAIVGYVHELNGIIRVYDTDGNQIALHERPLERPLLDPIDLIFLGGAAAISLRRLLQSARISGGIGGNALTDSLGGRWAERLRMAFRASHSEELKFTQSALRRMRDPGRRVPVHILRLAIRHGKRVPDPEGSPGAYMYYAPLIRNGKRSTLEILVRKRDNAIMHFLYR